MTLIERMRGKNLRLEPVVDEMPAPVPQFENMPTEVLQWVQRDTQQRQELAYLRSHAAQLENDVKVANERIRDLETELTHTRNARDWFCRHDASMLATLDDVEALIVNRKKSSRAQAYAPPGSGQQEQEPAPPVSPADEKILDGMTYNLGWKDA